MNNSHPNLNDGCPSSDELERVAKGMAAEDAIARVEQHLDGCTSCQERFAALLDSADDLAEIGAMMRGNTEADLESILAAGVPRFPSVQLDDDCVVLPGGLRLALPRKGCYQARLGDYDVLSVVGEGGMGIVLRAYHEQLDREVALKVIGARWLNDATARERFLQEARAAARLQHPNVVTIYGVSADHELPFIVMEYVRGKSLGLLIAEEGRLVPTRAAVIARQILVALMHAHAEGIIHRDIKPENILLGAGADERAAGSVKLVDFGLARGMTDAARHTAEGAVVGTVWYMSPEQASGALRIDLRSDLFSVGVVLFEMLTGALPFPGQDLHNVLERIRTEAAPDPRELNPDVPMRLARIVSHALEKQPDRRYQSASEFAQALDEFLAVQEDPGAPTPVGSLSSLREIAGGALQHELWCSACGEKISAPSSVSGRCEVEDCHKPICYKCWKIRRTRRCSQHADNSTPASLPPSKAAGERGPVLQTRVKPASDPSPESPKAEPASVPAPPVPQSERPAVSQVPAAAPPDERPAVEPSAEERLRAKHQVALKKIAQARAAGRTAISAYGAWLAEKSFLRMIEGTLRTRHEVTDPYRGVIVPVKNWSRIRRETGGGCRVTQGETRLSGELESLIRCPSAARVVFDVRKRSLWGTVRGRVVIEICHLANVDRFVREGYDDQPVSRTDLESLLNGTAVRAATSDAWHVLILASSTDWTTEARDFVTGRGPRPFRDRLVSVVIYDEASGRFLFDELDEKLSQFKNAFASDLDEATMARARKFIDEYLMMRDSIGIDTLVSELGISEKAADRVFRILESSGLYAVATIAGMGYFLSKEA
jgi:serine/threonine protein kinase